MLTRWFIKHLYKLLFRLINSQKDKSFYRPDLYLGRNEWRDINAPMSPWVREAMENGGKLRFLKNGRVQIVYKDEVRTFKQI